MKVSNKAVADALLNVAATKEIEAEARALQEKEHAIKRAEEAILAAIQRWTGEEIQLGEPLPRFRGGARVGTIFAGFFSPNPIREVVNAARIEERSEIERKIAEYKRLKEAADAMHEAFVGMGYFQRLELQSTTIGEIDSRQNGADQGRRDQLPLKVRLIHEIGLISSAGIANNELALRARAKIEELEGKLKQRKGTKKGRPRNEAAYAVALGLAKLYAQVTGDRPTYSAGVDGLSGRYTPALREVFDALGWTEINLRGPAEGAIAEISNADLEYEENTIGGLLSAWPK